MAHLPIEKKRREQGGFMVRESPWKSLYRRRIFYQRVERSTGGWRGRDVCLWSPWGSFCPFAVFDIAPSVFLFFFTFICVAARLTLVVALSLHCRLPVRGRSLFILLTCVSLASSSSDLRNNLDAVLSPLWAPAVPHRDYIPSGGRRMMRTFS